MSVMSKVHGKKNKTKVVTELDASSTADVEDEPGEDSVNQDDGDEDADILGITALLVAVSVEVVGALHVTLGDLRVRAGAFAGTRVVSVAKFVDHHAFEDIALVVDVVEHVTPEGVEVLGSNHETHGAHPKTIGEGGAGQSNDEDGDDGSDEDDK